MKGKSPPKKKPGYGADVYQELPTTIVSRRAAENRKNSAEYGLCKVKDGCIGGRVSACRKQ